MNEEEARAWIADRWAHNAVATLERFGEMLIAESDRQNLISKSTVSELWARHFVDSAQLVPLAERAGEGIWVDIGSGAGLPGIVAAILQERQVILVEPRRRRVEFLQSVVDALNLNATVVLGKAEKVVVEIAQVVSARAVAPLHELFNMAEGFTDLYTTWLLPKGRSGQSELVYARQTWHGVFHVEQSLTASNSHIVIARKVKRR